MPRVDALLDLVGGTHYLSTINLTKGYWQIPMPPQGPRKILL